MLPISNYSKKILQDINKCYKRATCHWHWGRNIGLGCLRTGCWGEYLGLRGMKEQENGEKCTMRSSLHRTLNCAGGKIEKNVLGMACGAYGGGERCAQSSSGGTWGKETTGRPRSRWEDNIKMDLWKWEWWRLDGFGWG